MKIEAVNIKKSFGENNVLKGISFQVQSSKALGILGRNGAGKTTAIRIVMGVFQPDQGEVLIDGKPIRRDQVKIGYLPEERGLYPKKVILEQLIYFAALKGLSKQEAKDSADKWLKRLEMDEYKKRRLDTLSKGNQQKIQLVVTLISNPDIVILDEPFSGLDPVNAMLLKDIVKELIHDGKIVLFSSHQMNYIEEFCEDIAILNNGGIVLDGNIKEIKRGYDRSKIVVHSFDAEKINEFIQSKLADIVEHSSSSSGEASAADMENGKLVVKLKKSEDKAELLARLAHEKFDIDEIKVFEPSLNDIFVEYTTSV